MKKVNWGTPGRLKGQRGGEWEKSDYWNLEEIDPIIKIIKEIATDSIVTIFEREVIVIVLNAQDTYSSFSIEITKYGDDKYLITPDFSASETGLTDSKYKDFVLLYKCLIAVKRKFGDKVIIPMKHFKEEFKRWRSEGGSHSRGRSAGEARR